MDALTITAGAGMRSRLEALDMLAHNIANAQTAGYKAGRELSRRFADEEAFASATGPHGPVTAPDNDSQWTDFSQGPLAVTGQTHDVALEGPGFFAVEGPGGRILLTRDGHFRLSATGRLETNDGLPVLILPEPRPPGQEQRPRPLQTQAADSLEIARDGTVRLRSPGAEPRLAGRLWLIEPPTGAGAPVPNGPLERAGNYFAFDRPAAEARPSRAVVHQGQLEGANVNAAETSVRLIGVMRQFETLNRALQLGGEMTKRVVEEVARAS